MNEHDELSEVLQHLALLEPTEADQPRPAAEALTLLQSRLAADAPINAQIPFLSRLKWRFLQLMSRSTKRLAWASAALILLIALFSLPLTRALASDFLGLFRVQKFAAISISPEQLARLDQLNIEGLQPPGELEMFEEPGQPEPVETLAEATAAAGRPVKTAAVLGDPTSIQVSQGGHGRLTVDVASARAILEAAEIDPTLLPDSLDGADIDVTTYATVMQRWSEDEVMLVQTASPEVDYPDDFDPSTVGRALLELLGMNPLDAAGLAQSIDWTSTLILPIPQEFATFGEISINGASGLLITAVDGSGNSIIWEENGVVYFLASEEMNANGLVNIAESLQ